MSDPSYVKTCSNDNCDNKYIATGKAICPPCNQERKSTNWVRLSILREERRKAKQDARLAKKQVVTF